MRKLLPILSLALAVVGCGGSSSSGTSTASFRLLPASLAYMPEVSHNGRTIAVRNDFQDQSFLFSNNAISALTAHVLEPSGFSPDDQTIAGTHDAKPALYTRGGHEVALPLPDTYFNGKGLATNGTIALARADRVSKSVPYIVSAGTVTVLPDYGPTSSNITSSVANTIAEDGFTVIGTSGGHPARWTNATSPTVQILTGAEGTANGTSRNGTVIVGFTSDGTGAIPFRWTESSGTANAIGLPTGATQAIATAVSADGNVVAGNAYVSTTAGMTYRPFVWTADTGSQLIQDLPGLAGSILTRMTACEITSISDNGHVIAGHGTFNGDTRSFVITLP